MLRTFISRTYFRPYTNVSACPLLVLIAIAIWKGLVQTVHTDENPLEITVL